MPNHKSAIQRLRTNERDRQKNKHFKVLFRNAKKEVSAATTRKEGEESLQKFYAVADKLASRRIIHKNKSANVKAKMAKAVNGLK